MMQHLEMTLYDYYYYYYDLYYDCYHNDDDDIHMHTCISLHDPSAQL